MEEDVKNKNIEKIVEDKYPGPLATGQFIKKLRLSHNLTQEEVGDMVYVTRKAVSKWETGLAYPSVDSLPRVAEVFGVTIDEILSGKFKDKDEIDTSKSIRFLVNLSKKREYKIIKYFTIFIVFLSLLIFYFENYNATKFYNVFYEDEEIRFFNNTLVTSHAQSFFNFGYLTIDNKDIDNNQTIEATLYIKNKNSIKTLIKTNINNAKYIEKRGYQELSINNITNNMDNFYLEIKYKNNSGEFITREIHLNTELDYRCNDLYKIVKQKVYSIIGNKGNYHESINSLTEINNNKTKDLDINFIYELYNNKNLNKLKDKNPNILITNNNVIIDNEEECVAIDLKNNTIVVENKKTENIHQYKISKKKIITFYDDNDLYLIAKTNIESLR